jgi:hypothetical protein
VRSREGEKSGSWEVGKVRRFIEGGSGTRRRPIKRDYAAAKDAEGGNGGKQKVGRWESERGRS